MAGLTPFSRARASYNHCGICGHTPRTQHDEPNRAPVRWWDPDDGWKIGTLCRGCWEEYGDVKPKATDYAVLDANAEGEDAAARIAAGVPDLDDVDTDEDPLEALPDDFGA